MKKTVTGFPSIEVAVAVIMNQEDQLLWTWNKHWGCFSIPMTKIRSGQGIHEAPWCAAVRAAAEALGVPVQTEPLWAKLPMMRVSDREYAVKHYTYYLFRAKPHPDFAAAVHLPQPSWWLPAHAALSGAYEPLSHSALDILREVTERQLISGRKQETCLLVIAQGSAKNRQFLLRFNPHWGYALPGKRKGPKESARTVADRVAREELGLEPKTDLTLKLANPPMVSKFGVSRTPPSPAFGVPTNYEHFLFDAVLRKSAKLRSKEPLAWATPDEIRAGMFSAMQAVPGAPKAPPARISRTVLEVLSSLGYVPTADGESPSATNKPKGP